jgi:hypothetical protein
MKPLDDEVQVGFPGWQHFVYIVTRWCREACSDSTGRGHQKLHLEPSQTLPYISLIWTNFNLYAFHVIKHNWNMIAFSEFCESWLWVIEGGLGITLRLVKGVKSEGSLWRAVLSTCGLGDTVWVTVWKPLPLVAFCCLCSLDIIVDSDLHLSFSAFCVPHVFPILDFFFTAVYVVLSEYFLV